MRPERVGTKKEFGRVVQSSLLSLIVIVVVVFGFTARPRPWCEAIAITLSLVYDVFSVYSIPSDSASPLLLLLSTLSPRSNVANGGTAYRTRIVRHARVPSFDKTSKTVCGETDKHNTLVKIYAAITIITIIIIITDSQNTDMECLWNMSDAVQ